MGFTWKQICADPSLEALPYRVESDEWGNAVLLPFSDAIHSALQSEIMFLLRRLLPYGKALVVLPLQTAKGIRTLDVAWVSNPRFAKRSPVDDFLVLAPEICVEVVARHHQKGEIDERKTLYFQRGATECWTCDPKGKMTFFDVTGKIVRSVLCPDFPVRVRTPELAA